MRRKQVGIIDLSIIQLLISCFRFLICIRGIHPATKRVLKNLLFPRLEYQLGEEYCQSPTGGIYTFLKAFVQEEDNGDNDKMGDFLQISRHHPGCVS